MERWQEAEYLFEATLDLPRARRVRFLADACAGDTELGILAAIEREAQSLFGRQNVVGSR